MAEKKKNVQSKQQLKNGGRAERKYTVQPLCV